MKLSDNVIKEIRLHLVFMAAPAVLVPGLWLAYRFGLFFTLPAWLVICFGIFMTVGLYIWFRQGLSPDKTRLKVRIW
jgi:type VI protein secretion system component VasF